MVQTSHQELTRGSLQKDDFSLSRCSNNRKFLYVLCEALEEHSNQLHPTSVQEISSNESKMLKWKYNTDFYCAA